MPRNKSQPFSSAKYLLQGQVFNFTKDQFIMDPETYKYMTDVLRVNDLDFIARGGFAEVWSGVKDKLPHAFKISHDPLTDKLRNRAAQEFEIMNHGAVRDCVEILQLHGWDEDSPKHKLITWWERCEESLLDRLEANAKLGRPGLPLEELRQFLYDAAKGIDLANELGFKHQDIKPSNLLVLRNRVKVADFGLAEYTGASTRSGSGSGTMGYMPLESFKKNAVQRGLITSTVDRYAFAATTIELTTGHHPFGEDLPEIFEAQKLGRPLTAGLTRSQADAALAQLHFDPAQRPFKTATEFVNAFLSDSSRSRETSVRTVSSAPAVRTLTSSATTSPAPSIGPAQLFHDDLLGDISKFEDDSQRRHERARKLEALGHYDMAIAEIQPVLAHVRDNTLLATLERKRDRVAVLAPRIKKAVDEKQHRWLRPEVEELLGLVPGDVQLAKLRDGLPKFPVLITLSNGTQLKFVPPGEFTMGDESNGAHRVRITRPFWLGLTAVTQAEWVAVMGSNPSGNKASDKHPVENVSWDDTQAFIAKLLQKDAALIAKHFADFPGEQPRLRVPSEAEREYATRAGTTTKWFCGNDETQLGRYAWYSANSGNITHPVGTKEPNPWGFYDLAGNVWEWCHDWYDAESYKLRAEKVWDDPVNVSPTSSRVFRGAGRAYDASRLASAFRDGNYMPDGRINDLGFRLALGQELK
ncbi:MAG: SUMF1/EgtB/PvdO family nonheme iron enzyme [Planctomycetaceae bacterium]